MKIEFSPADIEQMLIDKAAQMGLQANRCKIEASYGEFQNAKVWFEKPAEPAPMEPAAMQPPPSFEPYP